MIAAILTSLLAMVIEYHQAPGIVGYWLGVVSGASILALFEAIKPAQ